MATRTKIGVIGCGNISKAYLPAGKKFANLDVVACADIDIARAKAAAEEHGISRACSVDELLATPGHRNRRQSDDSQGSRRGRSRASSAPASTSTPRSRSRSRAKKGKASCRSPNPRVFAWAARPTRSSARASRRASRRSPTGSSASRWPRRPSFTCTGTRAGTPIRNSTTSRGRAALRHGTLLPDRARRISRPRPARQRIDQSNVSRADDHQPAEERPKDQGRSPHALRGHGRFRQRRHRDAARQLRHVARQAPVHQIYGTEGSLSVPDSQRIRRRADGLSRAATRTGGRSRSRTRPTAAGSAFRTWPPPSAQRGPPRGWQYSPFTCSTSCARSKSRRRRASTSKWRAPARGQL